MVQMSVTGGGTVVAVGEDHDASGGFRFFNPLAADISVGSNILSIVSEIGTNVISGIATKTNTINWTNVTTIASGVVALITQIGTDRITGIKTKTDSIDWANVTGIKGKTDTINWVNINTLITQIGDGLISGIKAKTDNINWVNITTLVAQIGTGLISGIKSKTDVITWADVFDTNKFKSVAVDELFKSMLNISNEIELTLEAS